MTTRPTIISFDGASYHVFCKGKNKQQVFFDNEDYSLFLENLGTSSELYGVEILSYCLMPNHFHLQIKTNRGNIIKFMKSFITKVTMQLNKKNDNSGRLFQHCYTASLVDCKEYKRQLSRYIHLIPININIKKHSLKIEKKLKNILLNYKWSSFRAYIEKEQSPNWLNKSYVLSSWDKYKYQDYAEKAILKDSFNDLSPSKKSHIKIIGKTQFIKKTLKTHFDNKPFKSNPILFNDIIKRVMTFYGISEKTNILMQKQGINKEARKIAIYLSVKYLDNIKTLKSLADKFNINVGALKMCKNRFSSNIKADSSLKSIIERVDVFS